MRKIALLAAMASVSVASLSTPEANAQQCGFHSGVNGRQAHQQSRIWQGVRSGQLTRQEANVLQQRQKRLAMLESRLRDSGGTLTASERYRLNHELNQLNRQIYRQSHDRQVGFRN